MFIQNLQLDPPFFFWFIVLLFYEPINCNKVLLLLHVIKIEKDSRRFSGYINNIASVNITLNGNVY